MIDVYEQEDVPQRLHSTGAKLRLDCEAAIRARGLQEHVQILGRDCNLVFATRDAEGQRSQGLRTLFMQELRTRGVLAPSFVVNLAHDQAAVELTVDAVRRPTSRRSIRGSRESSTDVPYGPRSADSAEPPPEAVRSR